MFNGKRKSKWMKKHRTGKKSTGGRNNSGQITVWHRGGGHKKLYRNVWWKRGDVVGVTGEKAIEYKVYGFEYDPNRTGKLAIIGPVTKELQEKSLGEMSKIYLKEKYGNPKDFKFILAPKDMRIGEKVMCFPSFWSSYPANSATELESEEKRKEKISTEGKNSMSEDMDSQVMKFQMEKLYERRPEPITKTKEEDSLRNIQAEKYKNLEQQLKQGKEIDYGSVGNPQGYNPQGYNPQGYNPQGTSMALKEIPLGTLIHNIEKYPGKGGQWARAAGAYAELLQKNPDDETVLIRLPSGKRRNVQWYQIATIGIVDTRMSLNSRGENVIKKAGRSRWLGKRPTVRGVAMNPVDHPHGGGEGRTSGGRPSVSPWGRVKASPSNSREIKRNRLLNKIVYHLFDTFL